MAMKRSPSLSPISNTSTMCGWFSSAPSRASSRNIFTTWGLSA